MLFSISLFAQSSAPQQKVEAYLTLGHKYLDARNLDSVKFCLKKADSLIRNKSLDSLIYYEKEVLAATLLIRENNAADAVQTLLKAQTYFIKQKDSANIGFTLIKLGVANYYLNRRLITRDYMQKALLYKNHLSKRSVTRIFQNLGTVNLEEGMGKKNDSLIYSAIKSYKASIKIYKDEEWAVDEVLATSLLSECYNQLGQYDTALKIIDKAVLLSKKIKNKTQEGFALIKKASFLTNKKRYLEALEVIKIAKSIFQETDDRSTYLYALREEKKILIGLKRYQEATVVGSEIFSTSVKSYNTRFADKVAEMDAKYKTAEKEKEIAEQKVEISKQELKIKQRNYFLSGMVGVIIFIVAISFFIYKQQKLKQQKLEEENRLKDELALVKVQNELHQERIRISRDLHDNIGAQLTFVISSVDNLKYLFKATDEKIKNKLTEVSNFTRTTITQLRDTIWALNKDEISFDDLKSRLYNYIEAAKLAQEQTVFEFKAKLNSNILLNSIQGVNIYRIVQEALNNTMKYAAATNVFLIITEKENSIDIEINDDGIGFKMDEIVLGNGLENMKNRATAINADFKIESSPDKGTNIQLIIKKQDIKLNKPNAV